MTCNTSPQFPMRVDVFYPMVEESGYGQLKKTWVFDKTISCYFSSGSDANKESVVPDPNIKQEFILVGRVSQDIRLSSSEESYSITNVIFSNLRSSQDVSFYNETSGIRKNSPTIFEIASNEAVIGPFGDIDYYKIVLRRSENQAVDL